MILPCATATSFLSRTLEADLGTMFPINLLLGQVLLIVAFRMALRKRYRKFHIALLPNDADLILDNFAN